MKRADVTWEGLIAKSPTEPSSLVIEGSTKDGHFVPERARGDNADALPRLALLPFGVNVLSLLDPTVFGREKRVFIKKDGYGLRLICKPGKAPAGSILKPRAHRFPQGLDQTIAIEGVARGEFRFAATVAGADAPTTALIFPRNEMSKMELSLGLNSSGLNTPRHDADQIVVLCPESAGKIEIKSIILQPDAKPAKPAILASWVWKPEEWQRKPGEVLAWAKSMQLDRLYLQLDIVSGQVAQPEVLGAFLVEAADLGIAVFAVEGDPGMIRGDGRNNALARTGAISRFQEAATPSGRLAGIQYDIEPYILPAYAFDRRTMWNDWSDTLKQLHALWRGKVEVVVPFWLTDDLYGQEAIERIRPFISSLAVMSYRTEDQAIVNVSEPWLTWGVLHGVDIVIALENGPIPDEVHRSYVRSETGTAELVRFSAADAVVLSDVPVSSKEKMIYRFNHEITVSGSRISFQGKLPTLLATIDRLRSTFPAWRSFSGFALHGLKQ
ncbi:hypothetical protein [Phyllobacterium bourgognense]|nr:hypothetical protein [Phyllobacterium bourgognense]